MKIIKFMKKQSLLSALLSFVLILSVCTCAFTVTTSAESTTEGVAPEFDSAIQTKVASFEKQTITETKKVLEIDGIIDKSKATYSKITVTRDDNNTKNTTPVIILAETDSNLVHNERGNFKKSYLVMWLAATGGYSIMLLNSDCVGPAVFPSSFAYFAGQQSITGFAGWSGVYPGGGTDILAYQEIITKVENGKISVWLKDGSGNIKEVLREYSSDQYNITGAAAGYLSSQKISNTYSYSCSVWVDKGNSTYDEPSYNSKTEKELLKISSTALKENTSVEYYDYSKYLADNSKAVYTTVTVKPEWQYTDWSSPYLMLAATDYKSNETDTATYNFGIRFTGGYGWTIALYNGQNGVDGYYVKNDQNYSSGSTQISMDGVAITSKLENGAISIWVDGTLVVDSYSNSAYSFTAPILGAYALNDNGYYLANVSVWTDNENYGYLGDINGDLVVDIKDLVAMKKLSAGIADYTAFNNAVKAFNRDGTIGDGELSQIREYLVGKIDKFTQR